MSWSEAPARPTRARRGFVAGVAAALCAPWLLAGCGFHLRASTDLAFRTLAVQGQGGALMQLLQRTIAATTSTRVVADPKQAEAVLTLLQDTTRQTPTAYNSDGTVAQYLLEETARFQLSAPDGHVLIAPTTISRTSRLSYSTSATLAKASEADMLYAGMRQALVDRMLFQLGNFRLPAAAASAASAASTASTADVQR